MKNCVLPLLVVALLSAVNHANGQGPSYGQTQINNFQSRSQASYFSANQQRRNVVNTTVPQYSFSQVNRGLFSSSLTAPTRQKPFTGAASGSSVSPWLSLSDPFTSSANNYYTQVRPQLDQQRANAQAAAKAQQMQRQINQMASHPPYDPSGNEAMAPTGHAAAFLNYAGYYAPVRPTKQSARQ